MSFTVLERAKALGCGVSKFYIDGAWRDPSSEAVWKHRHPASGEETFTLSAATDSDVDRAVRAARRAFDEGPWPRMGARQRKLLLRPIGDLLRANADHLHALQTLDNGMPIALGSSFRFSAQMAADAFEYYIGWIDKFGGSTPPVFSDRMSPAQWLTIKEPIGVVAAITPFNAPITQFAAKVAPALAAGCTIVFKPSEYASNVAAFYAGLLAELDLPPGVFNLVTGPASSSASLVSHPLIDKITFTGRLAVGQDILVKAAPGLKRVQLELGGKSPAIVFDDIPDVEAAGRYAMSLVSMGLSGQVCSTQTRAIVHRSIYDRFVSAAADQIGAVRRGDPFDMATTSAPLVNGAALDRVEHLVSEATKGGAKLVAGGRRDDAIGQGNWFEPTLFADVQNAMPIAQEEIFGPVLCVIPFTDEEEAVKIANDTRFGLAAGVYTTNTSRAMRVARAVRAGTVGVNGLFISSPSAPFGGYKMSGLGREGGGDGFESYLETKTISIALDG